MGPGFRRGGRREWGGRRDDGRDAGSEDEQGGDDGVYLADEHPPYPRVLGHLRVQRGYGRRSASTSLAAFSGILVSEAAVPAPTSTLVSWAFYMSQQNLRLEQSGSVRSRVKCISKRRKGKLCVRETKGRRMPGRTKRRRRHVRVLGLFR